MKAKQVGKDREKPKVSDLAETKHKSFPVGAQVRLQSLDQDGNYEVGKVTEVLLDYAGKCKDYRVELENGSIVLISAWFVKPMSSPARPE